MLAALAFPVIDPVAFQVGPIAIRWYALAYLAGLLLGWQYCLFLARSRRVPVSPNRMDDLLWMVTLGVVVGGRLGYVLFYNPVYFIANPLDILMVWKGGMAFHGGFLGVVAAGCLFAWRHGIPVASVADTVSAAAPIGLFFGRIANFINGELYGRASDVPWAMVFPAGGPFARHPSQLYEAGLEGLVLFVVAAVAMSRGWGTDRPGLVTGLFVAGYGISRFLVELLREPDRHLGFVLGQMTMGQLLSVPMVLAGCLLIAWSVRRSVPR